MDWPFVCEIYSLGLIGDRRDNGRLRKSRGQVKCEMGKQTEAEWGRVAPRCIWLTSANVTCPRKPPHSSGGKPAGRIILPHASPCDATDASPTRQARPSPCAACLQHLRRAMLSRPMLGLTACLQCTSTTSRSIAFPSYSSGCTSTASATTITPVPHPFSWG